MGWLALSCGVRRPPDKVFDDQRVLLGRLGVPLEQKEIRDKNNIILFALSGAVWRPPTGRVLYRIASCSGGLGARASKVN